MHSVGTGYVLEGDPRVTSHFKETSSFWKVSRKSGAGTNANPKADAVNKFTEQEAIAPA